MTKLSLTKSGLQKQRNELKLYKKLLPSLDLKRMQLSAELNKARVRLAEVENATRGMSESFAAQLPMLADEEMKLSGLVRITHITMTQENVVGVKLPKLERIDFEVFPYSRLAKPHWVDNLVDKLQEAARLRVETQVAERRVRDLELAVRRITQRVNLFDKILIPTAKKNIQRIQIFLGDGERSAVVRSKIAKSVNQRKRQEFNQEGAEA
ncbi:V-type ATPase, D subunit [Candidatus Moduliflexus flocculans]|uniref:V-type ATPase, D subunit n=1 Tax=Candidatus Moduliflexus flocculans TaxID=1499966 RepID=A0A081BLN0_9BACT|nr:V-type ATPase, D subunit [Candidatus Moduliflexus flocculans]